MPAGDDDTLIDEPAARASLPLIGEVIAGRYQVGRALGAGGMGRVHEAVDRELGERVAIKVLRAGLSDEALGRFRREVKLTRRIQHRNVARMFDIGEHGAARFLTMELVDGGSLATLIGAPVAWPRLQALAVQLCAGLAAAHAAGVVHRDLKPDNVLLDGDRVVITDFGIARSGDEVGVTQVGALIGTPRYMAPEQLAGEPVDHRADIFALGAILFELATGQRPWSGDSAIAIAVAQVTQPRRPLVAPGLPAQAARIIEGCLALAPDLRPASAAAVGDALAQAAGPAVEPAVRDPDSARRATDPRAVELYLRARGELRRFWAAHVRTAADLLAQAAQLAPGSPPILAAFAYAAVQAWIMDGDIALVPRAEAAVARALPTGEGEAYLASANLALSRGELDAGAAALGQALARAPMAAPPHEAAGRILLELDRDAARFHLETAAGLDPGRAAVVAQDLGRLDALAGDWAAAEAHCARLLGDPDRAVVQLGAVLEIRLATWRNDRPRMIEACRRFEPQLDHAARMIEAFLHVVTTGELDPRQWQQLEQMFARTDRPRRMQLAGLQRMVELAIVIDQPELALRALGHAVELGLIDLAWLDGCPLFARLAGDLRWHALRREVEARAAAMLAIYRAAS
jgi:hypothetical protein